MAKSKNLSNYVYVIVILSILLIVSVIFNFVGGFELHHEKEYVYQIGDDVELKLTDYGAENVSIAFSGYLLCGVKYKQKVCVVMPENDLSGYKLKVKVKIADKPVKIYGYSNWEEKDGYFEYNNNLYSNLTVGVCDEIQVDDFELKSNMVYYISFVFELYKI